LILNLRIFSQFNSDCYSASDNLLNSFAAKLELETWTNGVYLLPESLRTAIVAINELPITDDTLWLRILGRGETQRQAVSELLALPENNVLRENTLKLITNWRIILVQQQQNLTDEDQELIMNLSQAYQQWEQTTVQQGIQQERRELIENLLKFRFGSVDEDLGRVIDIFLELPADDFARVLLELPNLSREELLRRLDLQ
jgi:flagellar motility protein MotE (MotC chaperone)